MAVDTTTPRTRRAILLGALGGMAASVAATVGRASPVRAANDEQMLVGHTYTSTSRTRIDATGDVAIWGASDSQPGVHGRSGSGVGISGRSNTNIGVWGFNQSSDRAAVAGTSSGSTGVLGFSGNSAPPAAPAKTGVYGRSDWANGNGVYGGTTDVTTETYGVLGTTLGSLGRAVFGWSLNDTSGGTGVFGQTSAGTGVGVRGYAWDGDAKKGKFGTGVIGSSGTHAFPPPDPLPNTGVYGIGVNGRGGVFKGDKAQLRLVPSTAASHPSSGAVGDLFVDKSGRLWFCRKSGNPAIWKQVSLV